MIDISDVNVGDRVKLTRENGDEATFTVTKTFLAAAGVIESDLNRFYGGDWDALEIVERAFKPVPGLYSHPKGHRVAVTEDGEVYFTSKFGAWIPTNAHREHTMTYNAVRQLDGWEREITF